MKAHRQAAWDLRWVRYGSCSIWVTLVYTFERRVKQEASGTDEKVPNERHEKNCIMSMFEAVANALCSQVHEQKICQGVDNLRSVLGNNIVLRSIISKALCSGFLSTHLFTPVESRGDWRKPPVLLGWICYRRQSRYDRSHPSAMNVRMSQI